VLGGITLSDAVFHGCDGDGRNQDPPQDTAPSADVLMVLAQHELRSPFD